MTAIKDLEIETKELATATRDLEIGTKASATAIRGLETGIRVGSETTLLLKVPIELAAAMLEVRAAAVLAAALAVLIEAAHVQAATADDPVWAVVREAAALAEAAVAAAVALAAVAVAVVAAEAAAEAEAAAVEDEEDNKRRLIMKTNQIMKMAGSKRSRSSWILNIIYLSCVVLLLTSSFAIAQVRLPKLEAGQRAFSTPQEAADALVAAADKVDEAGFKELLGPNSYDLIHSQDPSSDKDTLVQFVSMAREKTTISTQPKNRNRALMLIGKDDWPFAIPLAKVNGKWFFDTESGRQELLFRRVGRNELDAIQVCRGFVEAEEDYSQQKHDGALVNQYAQRIISTPGKQDGLAWQNADGSWGGVVGEKAAKAIKDNYTGNPGAFHGYYFKVLKGQGPAAPKGEMDYMINGAMIGGFALLAYPAVYQGSGVKTFMVSNDGVVWEKDFGPNTVQLAGAIDKFNPDKTWSPVRDDQ